MVQNLRARLHQVRQASDRLETALQQGEPEEPSNRDLSVVDGHAEALLAISEGISGRGHLEMVQEMERQLGNISKSLASSSQSWSEDEVSYCKSSTDS